MYEFPSYPELSYSKNIHLSTVAIAEDPYDIKNIRIAYNNLKAEGVTVPSIQPEPNHLYLRFFPGNDSEWDILTNDTTLILYDYPLNTGFPESGCQDNSSPDDDPSAWKYCVVPVDKRLPDVYHEIIYEVFIPPDYTTRSHENELSGFYDNLIYESVRLTGNLDEENQQVTRSSSRKWTPKGRIRVWDDLLGHYIPLNHVNVHARWFTHIESDFTDEEGYFEMKAFRHKVNYSIKWENSLYTIRNGNFLQAWYNGPKLKGDWNLDIKGGKSMMFATVHRAAYRHFYGDNLGMSRPVLKSGGRTKICYIDDDGTGVFLGDWSAGGIIPDIRIYGRSNGNYKATNKIFGITTHELAHQAHSQYVGNVRFWKTSKMIRESWAEAVEWALTNEEYHRLGSKYGNMKATGYNHQYYKHNRWPFVDDVDYSPIFIDLVDEINQYIIIGSQYPNDLIHQYSMSYINHYILSNATDITGLRQQVSIHKLNGVDDFKISELFSLY